MFGYLMSVDKKINNTTILTSNQTTTTKTHTEKNNRKEKQRKLSTKHCVGARKKEGTDSSFNCENKKFLEGLSASTDAKCTETKLQHCWEFKQILCPCLLLTGGTVIKRECYGYCTK